MLTFETEKIAGTGAILEKLTVTSAPRVVFVFR
jgi:hypothetical protein